MAVKKKDLFENGKWLINYYRKNPSIAAFDLLRVDLNVPQRRMLEDMWFKNQILITAGRGTGKSFVCAVFACLYALLYPGQKIGLLGPSFRQAKVVFSEIDRIYYKAPILQEACITKPIKASDKCYLQFKQSGTSAASVIEAIPIGDGQKIRGARYYVIIADEFAQIPVETFNAVIAPMAATTASPMERVRRIQRQRMLEAKGLAVESYDEISNKMIMISSGYYQFNHMYSRIKAFQDFIDKGTKKYAVHNIPYHCMEEGFLDQDALENAKATMTRDQFRMEYGAEWISDSSGIFKASLIEDCRARADHTVRLKGKPGAEYVLGIDPARTKDAFAICVIELGLPNRLVAAYEIFQLDFPKMAKTIVDLCEEFNVRGINIDAGGGGLAIKDLLAEEERFHDKRILDADDENNFHQEGRKILHMINFNSKWISEANYNTLNLMEKGSLTIPKPPQIFPGIENLDSHEELYDVVKKLVDQTMSIEVTETRAGVTHFDLPEGLGGGHGKQKKDLYTSFILAGKLAYDLQIPMEDNNILLHAGIVESIQTNVFRNTHNQIKIGDNNVMNAPVINSLFKRNFK